MMNNAISQNHNQTCSLSIITILTVLILNLYQTLGLGF